MRNKLYFPISAFLIFLLGLSFISCKNTTDKKEIKQEKYKVRQNTTTEKKDRATKTYSENWVELIDLDSTFVLDLRYATTNNFVHKKMYPCPRCFVRPELAKALLSVQQELKKYGYRIKLFDCYRPGKVQKDLWKIIPDPRYVADPKKGSMHNRGLAVDLTLVDEQGKELDMGTPFDYFGKKAYHSYTDLPEKVLKNRKFLKNIMQKHGLKSIRTEWWHYSYRKKEYPVEQWVWSCDMSL